MKSQKAPIDYISPAWEILNYKVNNAHDAKLVISKYWLIGFTEAEGSFYLVSKEPTRIVHAFEITQKLDLIVLQAIANILGIALGKKKTYHTVVTTNSRSISNIIEYYSNTMKGIKAVEFSPLPPHPPPRMKIWRGGDQRGPIGDPPPEYELELL